MGNLFSGGVPTEPDVKRLLDAWPTLEVGQMITHDEIEAVLGVARTESRYRTVASRWRNRLLRDRDIVIKSVPARGFVVLAEFERVEVGLDRFVRGGRQLGRAVKQIGAAKVEKMKPEEQRRAEHAQRVTGAALADIQRRAKELTVKVLPNESNPRLRQIK